jgi:type IV pilus assembly protein PilZ
MDNTFISLTYKNLDQLYQAYMPFIDGGALFFSTYEKYKMNELVQVRITLLEYLVTEPFCCPVVWKTPVGSEGNKKPGVGLQLVGKEGCLVQKHIEQILVDYHSENTHSHTL